MKRYQPLVPLLGAIAAPIIAWAITRDASARIDRVTTASVVRGTIRGPAKRTTPAGTPAAAFWWTVANDDPEGDSRNCFARVRDQLVLDTSSGAVPIAWSSAPPDEIGLVSDDQDGELDRRYIFDLGARGPSKRDAIPEGTCEGERYVEIVLEPGAAMELIDGAILAPDRATHLAHLAWSVRRTWWIAGALALAMVIGAAFIRWNAPAPTSTPPPR